MSPGTHDKCPLSLEGSPATTPGPRASSHRSFNESPNPSAEDFLAYTLAPQALGNRRRQAPSKPPAPALPPPVAEPPPLSSPKLRPRHASLGSTGAPRSPGQVHDPCLEHGAPDLTVGIPSSACSGASQGQPARTKRRSLPNTIRPQQQPSRLRISSTNTALDTEPSSPASRGGTAPLPLGIHPVW